MEKFDVTVIGSGPGGYVAAIRSAQLGFKTAIIEKYPTLGGTCLNVGCIPSKTLLDSSEHYFNAKHSFSEHGILVENLRPDLTQMINRKNQVVKITCDGINFLMKKNKITVYRGTGSFESSGSIKITSEDGSSSTVETTYSIIATGSKPSTIPGITVDKKRIITSTEALNLKEIPKHLIVIGGGVIGLELGSVYARLGSEVSVLEYLDRLIPAMDGSISKELQRVLGKIGMKFYLNHKVEKVEAKSNTISLKATSKDNKPLELRGDYCLVSVGRKAYTDGLNIEKLGINTDDRGRVLVNEKLETSVKNIYAIGDVIKGAMLAHKAEEEGVFVAEVIAGQHPHINYNAIPNVVYTWPEVAGVGYTEEQLKESGRKYKTGQFPFRALGRARASMDLDGLVKILADAETDELLGMHIIGARAADMIGEGVTALEFRASAEDIARMSHAHPTYMEAIKEAALDATAKRPLHS